jgi:hypothetical protein
MYNAFTYMLREGGVRGLWRGNGINIIKVTNQPIHRVLKKVVFRQKAI